MAQTITKHSKERIVERTEGITFFEEAKRVAKIAKKSGKTINDFQRYPKTFRYLQRKSQQTCTCKLRVYRGNIYIWRGKDILMTAYPFPEWCIKEMEELG